MRGEGKQGTQLADRKRYDTRRFHLVSKVNDEIRFYKLM